MATWCIFHGGPSDGLMLPTADHWCTRRMVIYRGEARSGADLTHPAVYLRDETDQGTHSHAGMDGVSRESPSLGYRFERYVSTELAGKIERVREVEANMETL